MTTVVETGAIVAGANSYISDADFATYASNRGITVSGVAAQLLLKAALYVETLSFIGSKRTKEQDMQWPRYDVYIDGFTIDSNEIPTLLKDLQAEVALAVDAGNNPLSTVPRAVKKQKVDVIEIEYADNASPFVRNRKIKALERKITYSTEGLSFRTNRG